MRRILNTMACLSLSLSISCNHLSNSAMADYSNVTQIQYDKDAEDVIVIDSVVDSCRYVRLRTDKSYLIGKIDQLLLCDSFIVVIDKHIAQSILVFDYDGNFLNRISRLGNGPGEYLIINHVAINDRKEVCILDNAKERITIFDINGKMIESKHLPFRGKSLEYLGNNNLLFRVENCYAEVGYKEIERSSFVLTEMNGNIIYTFGDDHSYRNPSYQSYSDNIYKYDGRLYGRLDHGNLVYEFDKDSVIGRFELSLKNDKLYSPTIEDMSTPGLYKEKRLQQPSFSGTFFVCADYSCFRMMFPERTNLYTWFFRINNTGRILTLSTESNDPLLACFNNPLSRWRDNTLVQEISPTVLLSRKNEILENSKIEKKEALFEGLSLEDNPVLFFYSFNTTVLINGDVSQQ